MTRPPRVSVGIPLYRSRAFLDSLQGNCEALAAEGDVEVIVSDRHGLDDTIDVLHEAWGHDPRFRFLRAADRLDWVAHMNLLLCAARGDYFRWMPHDDVFPSGCLKPLIDRLESDPATILAYAPTRAIDAAGDRLPERDALETHPLAPGAPVAPWRLENSLDLFWRGICIGSFKGLFRRPAVMAAGLLIRPTYELVSAERAWLFGISLLGGLGVEPTSEYFKRFHPDSVHAQWRPRARHVLSATSTMCGYLRDFGASPRDKGYGMIYLWMKAAQRLSREARSRPT